MFVVIASIITAIVAIVPNVIGLINQRKTDEAKFKADEEKSRVDMNTAASNAALAIIQPLQNEIGRLQGDNMRYQSRILELENDSMVKTEKIGKLMQENIAKDTELLTMKYRMEKLQMRIDSTPEEQTNHDTIVQPRNRKKKDDTVPPDIKSEIQALEYKKQLVKEDTERQLEEIKSKSITNGGAIATPPEIGE